MIAESTIGERFCFSCGKRRRKEEKLKLKIEN